MGQHPLATDLDEVLERARDLWEEFRGKRFFVTGGTGFFGSWFLESFAWANERLNLNSTALVLSRDPGSFLKRFPHLSIPAIQFHKGDIESFEFPGEFPDGRFSFVIHAATAASAKLNEESPLIMFDNVVQGTRRALEFAKHCGAEKFLFTSSGAVYGKQPSELTQVSEEYAGGPDPLDSKSAYGEAKRAAEFLCATYARQCGFEAKIARCFAFVGPYLPLDAHFAIGNFIRDGLRGGKIQVGGDGTPYRSYLYASDLIVWLLTILHRGKSCRPYNVGSADGRPISEIARAVAKEFGREGEVAIARAPDPAKAPDRYVPSVSRAGLELGLKPTIELGQAIQRTIRFHQKQRQRLS